MRYTCNPSRTIMTWWVDHFRMRQQDISCLYYYYFINVYLRHKQSVQSRYTLCRHSITITSSRSKRSCSISTSYSSSISSSLLLSMIGAIITCRAACLAAFGLGKFSILPPLPCMWPESSPVFKGSHFASNCSAEKEAYHIFRTLFWAELYLFCTSLMSDNHKSVYGQAFAGRWFFQISIMTQPVALRYTSSIQFFHMQSGDRGTIANSQSACIHARSCRKDQLSRTCLWQQHRNRQREYFGRRTL